MPEPLRLSATNQPMTCRRFRVPTALARCLWAAAQQAVAADGRASSWLVPFLRCEPMPSIEILCIGLTAPEPPPETSFAVICDPDRKSHRGPSPRFQSDFDRLGGVLY